MASFTPGFNFAVDDLVTGSKLRTFIEDTTIGDVNFSEIDPSIPKFAVVADTAFSVGPEGSVFFDTIAQELMVMSRWGPVALWSPIRMETRRLQYQGGVGPTFATQPYVVTTFGSPAGSATEPAYIEASGLPASFATKCIGIPMFDTSVSTGDPGFHARVCLHGVTKARTGTFNEHNQIGEIAGVSTSAGQVSPEGDPDQDRVCCVILGESEDQVAGSETTTSGVSAIVYFWPGNFWRHDTD